jgi:subtilisin family serine protease
MLTSQEIIAQYYVGYYNRAPDPEGFAFWVNALDNGISTLEIANFFSDQVETRALYPFFANPDSSTPSEFITSIYQNLFNRDSDSDGLDFWVRVLTDGSVSTGQMIEEIIGGATTNPDLAVVQNKVAAGLYWEDQASDVPGFTYSGEVPESASTVLNIVTDDVGTVALSRAQTDSLFSNLADDKAAPGSGLTNDGSATDKIGLFNKGPLFESSDDQVSGLDIGNVSTLSVGSADVLNLTSFRADGRFEGIDGRGLTVVVIDTGIDLNHEAFGPDLDENGVSDRIIFTRDFSGEGDGTADDVQSHGTHVASIIGSSASGFTGVAPGVNIVALQALDNSGSGSSLGIEASLKWVVANAETLNIVAVNMSLGGIENANSLSTHPVYGDELRTLHTELGVITVVAAGNAYRNMQVEGVSLLSADPNTISVGAIGGTTATGGDIASFSQRSNDIPTIFAPGAGITAAVPGGGTGEMSGTSMASPQVAGVVVLAQQLAHQELGRFLTPDEVQQLLTQTSDTFNDDENVQDRVINTGLDYSRVDMFDLGEAIIALRDGGTQPVPRNEDTIAGTIATNASITVGSPVQSAINVSGDVDFFEISLTPGVYEFSLNGAVSNSGILSDPLLTLYSSSGSFLTTNDDGGTGLNSLIEYSVSTDETYYLGASAFAGAAGTYELSALRTGSVAGSEISETVETTGRLSVEQSVSNELEFGADRDWFAIDLTANQRYQFDLVGNTLSDPTLFLYGPDGTPLSNDDDSGDGLNAQLEFAAVTTGTYFVSAEAFSNTMTGTYDLSATLLTAETDDFGTGVDTSGRLEADGGTTTGTLEQSGDTDWFEVNLLRNVTYEFSLTGSGEADGLGDPLLELLDAAGRFIGADDDGGEGFNSLITYSTITDQTVYLSADSYGSASTGSYTIASVATSLPQQDTAGDTSTTAVLSLGDSIAGALEQAGDADWYAVDVEAGQNYNFSLTRSGDTPMEDPYLILFDDTGNFIAFDDDGGEDRDAAISYQAATTGRVFISAEAFDLDTDMGTYEIALTTDITDIAGDTSTTAVLSLGDSIAGALEQAGDTDWYAVDVEAGQNYDFSLTRSGDTPMEDPRLILFDDTGNFITSDDDSGEDLDAAISYQAATTGRVFISAGAFDLDTDMGTYEIALTTDITDIAGDTSTTAVLSLGDSIAGALEQAGDTDWYAVDVEAGQNYDFSLTRSGDTPMEDPRLILFDDTGNFITSDDDSGEDLDAAISYQAATTGRVFISAGAFDLDTDMGTYGLSVTSSPSPTETDVVGQSSNLDTEFG